MTDKPDNPESQENIVTFDKRRKRGRREEDRNQDSVSFKGNSPNAEAAQRKMELAKQMQDFMGSSDEREELERQLAEAESKLLEQDIPIIEEVLFYACMAVSFFIIIILIGLSMYFGGQNAL